MRSLEADSAPGAHAHSERSARGRLVASLDALLRPPATRLGAAAAATREAAADYFVAYAGLERDASERLAAERSDGDANCGTRADEVVALGEWARAFGAREGRPPTVWLDALSADPLLRPSEQLAHTPVYVARCDGLLLLCGPSTVDNLRTVAQLYAWRASGGRMSRVECVLVAPPELEHAERQARWRATIAAFDTFHLEDARAPEHAEEAKRIAHAIELGTIAHFNETIRSFMAPVQRAASAEAALRAAALRGL